MKDNKHVQSIPHETRKISDKTTIDALRGIAVEIENFDVGRRIYS
jgi:hypothetical protein